VTQEISEKRLKGCRWSTDRDFGTLTGNSGALSSRKDISMTVDSGALVDIQDKF
jgi:hypothetical protein